MGIAKEESELKAVVRFKNMREDFKGTLKAQVDVGYLPNVFDWLLFLNDAIAKYQKREHNCDEAMIDKIVDN